MTDGPTTDLLADIADVGRDPHRGGYSRHGFDACERELHEWFREQAARRGLDVTVDRNGNAWAWWGAPGRDAVVTGSHLDSVPGGGAFDGPLGVVSALGAVDRLRARNWVPRRPFAVTAFREEEGGRFGVPCLGSRLATGSIARDDALRLTDPDGTTLADAAAGAGLAPQHLGRDDESLDRIGCFLELHVEQGVALAPVGAAVGVAESIKAHGRWRFTISGQGNHAGTTRPVDRRDPMLPAAQVVAAARAAMARVEGGTATVGRLVPTPGGTNVIASTVDLWLDARAGEGEQVRAMVSDITGAVREAAAGEGCEVAVREESYGDTVRFDPALRDELAATLGGVPVVPTGAGHDAGILAARVPTAMLFVRNPTGVSHAPDEHAEPTDCEAGTEALARVLERVAG